MLSLSIGNGKLKNDRLIFNLPAGKTCPGALFCKSFVILDENGKRKVKDGEHTEFRCFAASSEALFDAPYQSRKANLEAIVNALKVSVNACADLIDQSIQHHRTKKVTMVRIHESGDFFSGLYLDAWIQVAIRNPDLKFYCYTKSLQLFQYMKLPANFYVTASKGGKWDPIIEAGQFQRYSVVVKDEAEANALGLEIDHDDSHCFGDKPFALLVHGTQPAGSTWGQAIRARKKAGAFVGYNKKTKVS